MDRGFFFYPYARGKWRYVEKFRLLGSKLFCIMLKGRSTRATLVEECDVAGYENEDVK